MKEVFEVKLSDVGEGIVEAEIASVLVSIGEAVSEDQVLVEIMTEKVTIEIPSPVSGTIKEVKVQDGDMVVVGSSLISIVMGEEIEKDRAIADANAGNSIEHSESASRELIRQDQRSARAYRPPGD